MDLALNKIQRLIGHKIQTTNQSTILILNWIVSIRTVWLNWIAWNIGFWQFNSTIFNKLCSKWFYLFRFRQILCFSQEDQLKNLSGKPLVLDTSVAEGILYFCLARNLIRPLESTHNFTQSGWLILFTPDHLSGQHKLGKSFKHSFWQNNFIQCRRLTVCSSIAAAAAAWGKPSNSWTPCVYFS